MIKTITRALVIKALKTETLRRGNWFAGEQKKDCSVCAVGAVLRHCSFETWARKKSFGLNSLGWEAVKDADRVNGSQIEDTEILLEDKNYLAALSNYFELGNSKNKCIAFVEENFPKSFKLTITPY